jgi:hypothetical protein
MQPLVDAHRDSLEPLLGRKGGRPVAGSMWK